MIRKCTLCTNSQGNVEAVIIISGQCAIIYGKAIARVHSGHLNVCVLETGGHQLKGQATDLTFESTGRLLQAKHSPTTICIITQP